MNSLEEKVYNKLSKKGWIDFQHYKIEKYDEIRDRFISLFEDIEEVISLYEFGKVKNPGISDIDLAIVLSKETMNNEDLNRQLEEIYQNSDFNDMLCGGTVMVFSEEDFPLLNLLDDIEVHRLYGKKIDLIVFNSSKETMIRIFQIFDWLPERLLSLSKVLSKDKILIKSVLGYLYSIRYTFRILDSLGIVKEQKLNDFINSIESLRNNWFNYNSEIKLKQLYSLIISMYTLGEKYIWMFSSWSEEKFNIKYINTELPIQFNLTQNSGFLLTEKKDNYLSFLNNSLDSTEFFLPVPSAWMYHWSIYSYFDGFISEKIDKNLKSKSIDINYLEGDYLIIAEERIGLCNNMAQFLFSRKIEKGLYKFGWFYK
ncbi:hypothetical protein HOK00_09750 [bacterium]|nr:hypothetical protein [bacterium]